MHYKYECPSTRGYKKVRLTRVEHKRLFHNRPLRWHNRYEYYIRDSDFLIRRFTGIFAVFLIVLMSPVIVLFYGLANIKETFDELKRIVMQKKYGAFSSDVIFKTSPSFPAILKAIGRK